MGECAYIAMQNAQYWPKVGAVVVKKGSVVGRGYSGHIDGTRLPLHAERMALDDAGRQAKGAALFTTLEPCTKISQNQLLGSCCDYIAEQGIDTVVFGMLDEHSHGFCPGEGIAKLQSHGIYVVQYAKLNTLMEEKLSKPLTDRTVVRKWVNRR